jgi:hypothetical protein
MFAGRWQGGTAMTNEVQGPTSGPTTKFPLKTTSVALKRSTPARLLLITAIGLAVAVFGSSVVQILPDDVQDTVEAVDAFDILEAEKASAYQVRPGWSWNQLDLLLDHYETRAAASGPRQANWICAPAAVAASRISFILAGYLQLACVTMVTVCAARALAVGRQAGVTFQVYPHRVWCWNY